MSDFDFDELDRAVSSVLSKTKEDNTEQSGTPATLSAGPATAGQSVPVVSVSTAPEPNTAATGTDEPSTPTLADAHADESRPGQTPPAPVPDVPAAPADSSTDDSDEAADASLAAIDLTPLSLDNIPAAAPDMPEEHVPETLGDDTRADNSTPRQDTVAEPTVPAAASPAADAVPQIPTRRGRFMDVVSPAAAGTERPPIKPAPARSTVTLQPSAEFIKATHAPAVLNDDALDAPADTTEADHVTSVASNLSLPDEDEATPAHEDTLPVTMPSAPVADDAPVSDTTTAEPSGTTVTTEEAATPFIPDVSVDKRPLNTLSADETTPKDADTDATADKDAETPKPIDTDTPKSDDTDNQTVPPVVAAAIPVPKEFNKEIMAVEANETIGTVSSEGTSPVADKPAATDMHHPIFDTSSLTPQSTGTVAHPTSKMTWIVIGAALFLVGAVLGVLYFLYGQS